MRELFDKVEQAKEKVKTKKKDILKRLISTAMLVIVLLLNGFLSFITLGGFDFSKLKTSIFWITFGILLLSEIMALIVTYINKKIKNLQDNEIVDLSTEINKSRNRIYKLNKPKVASYWLRVFYNPREKINLFEDEINTIQESLNIDEPFEIDKNDKNYRKYLKEKKRFEKNIAKYDWCSKQLDLIKRFREKLELVRKVVAEKSKLEENKIDNALIEDLENQIKKIDDELIEQKFAFKPFKIKHYETIYWDTLTAGNGETVGNKRQSAYFHESKLIFTKIQSFILSSLFTTAFLGCMLPPNFNTFSLETIIVLVIKLVLFGMACLHGLILADSNILVHYKNSLSQRKTIYNELNFDLGVSNIEIEEKNKNELTNKD